MKNTKNNPQDVVQRLLDNPELALGLQDAGERLLVEDLRRLADPSYWSHPELSEDADAIEQMAAAAEVMPHFDNMSYRQAILLVWSNCVRENPAMEALEETSVGDVEDLDVDALGEEALASLEWVTASFEHIYFDERRLQLIEDTVMQFLERNQCGKALKIVRENAPYLSHETVADLSSRIWNNVAAMDSRFQMVPEAFASVADGCRVLFRSFSRSTPEAAEESESALIADLQDVAADGPYDCVDELGVKRIEEMVSYGETMRHFDSEAFRDYLLEYWRYRVDGSAFDVVQSGLLLSPEALSIAEEVVADFELLFANRFEVRQRTRAQVDEALAHNRCGDALWRLQVETTLLDPVDTVSLAAKIWDQVSRCDNRFEGIAAGLKHWSLRLAQAD